MNESTNRLILVVAASYSGAVGFGDLFDCEIKRVVAGALPETRIRLSVMAGDKKNLQFISAHLSPAEMEMGFTLNREEEPYNVTPITGFVDQSRTSWEMEHVREATTEEA